MRIAVEDLLEDVGPQDLSANFELQAVDLSHIVNYSIQLVFTGSPTGNFKLQCSNDDGRPNAASETNQRSPILNWTDIADSAQAITAAGNHTWDVQNAGYKWVRVVWTNTGGTGSLTSAKANVKGV